MPAKQLWEKSLEKKRTLKKQEDLQKASTDTVILYHIKILLPQLPMLIIREIETKLNYMKYKNFEFADNLGKWLAHELRKEREKNTILKIQKCKTVLTDNVSIHYPWLLFKFVSQTGSFSGKDWWILEKTVYQNFHNLSSKLWTSYKKRLKVGKHQVWMGCELIL